MRRSCSACYRSRRAWGAAPAGRWRWRWRWRRTERGAGWGVFLVSVVGYSLIFAELHTTRLEQAALCIRMSADAAPAPGYWRLHISCGGQPLPRTPLSVVVCAANAAALPGKHLPVAAAAAAEAVEERLGSSGSEGQQSREALGPDTPGSPSPAATTSEGGEAAPAGEAPSSPTPPLPPPPVVDQSRVWEQIAAAAFAADGSTAGWDSDDDGNGSGRRGHKSHQQQRGGPDSSEQRYLAAHPGVPVVESLEDIWKVSRLQRERKQREERQRQKHLQVPPDAAAAWLCVCARGCVPGRTCCACEAVLMSPRPCPSPTLLACRRACGPAWSAPLGRHSRPPRQRWPRLSLRLWQLTSSSSSSSSRKRAVRAAMARRRAWRRQQRQLRLLPARVVLAASTSRLLRQVCPSLTEGQSTGHVHRQSAPLVSSPCNN